MLLPKLLDDLAGPLNVRDGNALLLSPKRDVVVLGGLAAAPVVDVGRAFPKRAGLVVVGAVE